MNSVASFLSRLQLFAEMSAETLARLEHRMRRRAFASRAVIVREGGSGDSAFLALAGRVAVRLFAEYPAAVRTLMTALADRLEAARTQAATIFGAKRHDACGGRRVTGVASVVSVDI